MDVLRVLAEANGHIVSTEELLLRCWRGTFYGDSPVHKTIAQLRAAVGDSALAPSFIATVRKRGYRIMPAVQFPEGYAARPAGPRATWPNGNPFRGLQPFALEHAAVYFGRTKAIADVLAALRRQREQGLRFVLCVGASGVGKSSLLQAGVAPELRRGGVAGELDPGARPGAAEAGEGGQGDDEVAEGAAPKNEDSSHGRHRPGPPAPRRPRASRCRCRS